MPSRSNRRAAYNPVTTVEDGNDESHDNNNNNNNNTPRRVLLAPISKEDTPLKVGDLDDDSDDSDDTTEAAAAPQPPPNMTVIILDSAQKRFEIPCNASWTIREFKKQSAKIHKVMPEQQRLIFRGKMLTDDHVTLQDLKITEPGVIIHLFPKPRVVVVDSGGDDTTNTPTQRNSSGSGAHIPSIVINEEEQERRSQILVLGSVEIAESQNNVKMLSLLLLVITSMRLLALLSIAMGVAEEPNSGNSTENNNATHAPTSSTNPYNSNTQHEANMQPREWRPSDYFDLTVSAIGFYVATLGMKATQENTSRLANRYLIGTVIAGIGWNAWNAYMYYAFYEEETTQMLSSDDDDLPPLTRDDFITVAFFTVCMPLFVWGVCCARAYEFRRLIGEAEEEASERIRSQQQQLTMTTVVEDGSGEADDGNNGQTRRSGRELMDLSATRTEIV